MRRSGSFQRALSMRRSDSLLSSKPPPTHGARASEPGACITPHPPTPSLGRLSEAGLRGGPSILNGPGGRFTRAMTLRRSGAAGSAAAEAVVGAAVDSSMRCSVEGGAVPPRTRGSLRCTLNGSMTLRSSAPLTDLPVNPLHAAVLHMYTPAPPDTPPPSGHDVCRYDECEKEGGTIPPLPRLAQKVSA